MFNKKFYYFLLAIIIFFIGIMSFIYFNFVANVKNKENNDTHQSSGKNNSSQTIQDDIFKTKGDKVIFLQKDPATKRKSIARSNFDGSEKEKLFPDKNPIGFISLSPNFDKAIVLSENPVQSNYKRIQLSILTSTDFGVVEDVFGEWNLKPEELADSYLFSDYNLRKTYPYLGFFSRFMWSLNEDLFSWSEGFPSTPTNFGGFDKTSFVRYSDTVNMKDDFTRNPFSDDYAYFESIKDFKLSPNGHYIALISRNVYSPDNFGALILYRTNEDKLDILEEEGVSEIFFDIHNNLHYSVPEFYKWITIDPITMKKTLWDEANYHFSNRPKINPPPYWDKLKYQIISPDFTKYAYLCERNNRSICITNTNGDDEKKIFSLDDLKVKDYEKSEFQDLPFWSPDSNFIFVYIGNGEDSSFYTISVDKMLARKISD